MKRTRPSSSVSTLGRKSAAANAHDQARLAVDLPVAMHRQLKIRAAMQGKTIRDYVMWLLEKDGIPTG